LPIYEYICADCHKRSSLLIRTLGEPEPAKCDHCGSSKIDRIMSRFAAVKSDESRMESMADPSKWGGLDENDPASVARFIKKMGSELGEDIGKDELDQMAEEAAKEAESGTNESGDFTGNAATPSPTMDLD
jgi:putative FmdB family regulatory protein